MGAQRTVNPLSSTSFDLWNMINHKLMTRVRELFYTTILQDLTRAMPSTNCPFGKLRSLLFFLGLV